MIIMSFCAVVLSPLPKPYIHKKDLELKDSLSMFEVVHKIID
jgi:hypothetical protein